MCADRVPYTQTLFKVTKVLGYLVTVNGKIWPPYQVSGKRLPTKSEAKRLRKEVKAEMGKATVRIKKVESMRGEGLDRIFNPKRSASSYTSYQVYRFGYLRSARKYAQEEANRTGVTAIIYPSGKGSPVHVPPKRTSNPLPRGKWLKGKIKITSGGKIQFARGRS